MTFSFLMMWAAFYGKLMGGRVQLHLPRDLAARFATHANRLLLEKSNSRAVLSRLRQSQVPEAFSRRGTD